ncbi:hypothetical protein BDZ94DRAFT_1295366 [Collybia nuda]|uniref:Uncharacterized protein n=1 Tax=Collybia nuda TaxID=64659 RepID=A0A9P6CI34_9AGAR|nr:hypothetical protein BDZ94DRAFT_1295366 [Collybia nuda]
MNMHISPDIVYETSPLNDHPVEDLKMEVIYPESVGPQPLVPGVKYVSLEKFGTLRNFKFSPDGKYLATTSWKADLGFSTTIIFQDLDQAAFRNRYVYKTKLLKYSSGPRQLVWSFDSAYLVIRYERVIDIWKLPMDAPCTVIRVKRHSTVQSVRWYNEEPAFLCIESHTISKIKYDGTEEWSYRFPDIHLYDGSMAPTNCLVLLCHCPSIGGVEAGHRSIAEKRITVVYHFWTTSLILYLCMGETF